MGCLLSARQASNSRARRSGAPRSSTADRAELLGLVRGVVQPEFDARVGMDAERLAARRAEQRASVDQVVDALARVDRALGCFAEVPVEASRLHAEEQAAIGRRRANDATVVIVGASAGRGPVLGRATRRAPHRSGA